SLISGEPCVGQMSARAGARLVPTSFIANKAGIRSAITGNRARLVSLIHFDAITPTETSNSSFDACSDGSSHCSTFWRGRFLRAQARGKMLRRGTHGQLHLFEHVAQRQATVAGVFDNAFRNWRPL